MKYRKGVSAVVFRREKKPLFLLLHRKLNWSGWEIPKGGLKGKESEEKCLKRELKEETGIKKYLMFRTNYKYKYPWTKEYIKDNKKFHGAHFRLFVVLDLDKTDRIKVDRREHSGYKWVDAKKALKLLTYKDQKDALRFVLKNYF